MHGSSRIFGILDAELSRHLSFGFSVSENLSRPGSTVVRPSDRFLFTVWAVNRSDIALCWLRGTIAPNGSTRFTPVPFGIPRLAPGERIQIAAIVAHAAKVAGRRYVPLDTLGSVTVTISPDLSDLRLRKTKPLTYVQPRLGPVANADDRPDSAAV